MKKIIYVLSITFIIFSLFSCESRDDRLIQLDNYLMENFNVAISNRKTVFLFIPDNQCKNCIQINKIDLPKSVLDNTYIITSFPKRHFVNFKNVFVDSTNKMFNLEFIDYSNTLITIENGNIVNLKNYINIEDELKALK